MKHILRLVFMMLVFMIMPAKNLYSQIILTPQVSGTVHQVKFVREYFKPSSPIYFAVADTYYYVIPDNITLEKTRHSHTGITTWSIYLVRYLTLGEKRGIVEFQIKGDDHNPLPAGWMTQWNWTAMLKGFRVHETSPGASVMIFEQNPQFSDGVLNELDFNSSDHSRKIYHSPMASGTRIDPIDITDQLRNCLFNEYPSDYIGAVLRFDHPTGTAYLTEPFIEINQLDPKTPTPLPTFTPKPPQPTQTPEPGPDFRLTLNLNRTMFSPGDPFHLVVTVEKPDGNSYYRQPLFLLLDVYGEYYFYPSWNPRFDYKLVDITTFIESIPILNFEWPKGSGSANGIAFHAAILNSAMTSIAGNTDTVVFGWTDGY